MKNNIVLVLLKIVLGGVAFKKIDLGSVKKKDSYRHVSEKDLRQYHCICHGPISDTSVLL